MAIDTECPRNTNSTLQEACRTVAIRYVYQYIKSVIVDYLDF